MIKIGSGKYRSRQIDTPLSGTLPTKNRVREAMMNMVSSYLPDANVLDLFAGSGALGIEALSRGAKKAWFCDASKEAASVVRNNLAALKERSYELLCQDYRSAMASFREPFDVVFLDPPYAMKEAYQWCLNELCARGLLKDYAAVILEYEGDLEIDDSAFSSRRDYTYGKTKVVLLERQR